MGKLTLNDVALSERFTSFIFIWIWQHIMLMCGSSCLCGFWIIFSSYSVINNYKKTWGCIKLLLELLLIILFLVMGLFTINILKTQPTCQIILCI